MNPTDSPSTQPPANDPPKAGSGERFLCVFTPFLAGTTAMTALDHLKDNKTGWALFEVLMVVMLLGTAWRWSRG